MNYKEINQLSVSEINTKLSDELVNLRKLKFSHAISPIDNPLRIRYSRRLIAKLYTSLKTKNKDIKLVKDSKK